MIARLNNVQVLTVENNDFVNKDGKKVYLSEVLLYDVKNTNNIKLNIRDDSELAKTVSSYLQKNANVDVDITQQKGGYSFFVNMVGISKNGGQ